MHFPKQTFAFLFGLVYQTFLSKAIFDDEAMLVTLPEVSWLSLDFVVESEFALGLTAIPFLRGLDAEMP